MLSHISITSLIIAACVGGCVHVVAHEPVTSNIFDVTTGSGNVPCGTPNTDKKPPYIWTDVYRHLIITLLVYAG